MNATISDNLISQMRKGYLEYCILLLILQKKQAYVSDLIAWLKESKMIVVEGTLYPLLNRLKNQGILDYSWVESTQGPPRKYYILTKSGHELVQALEQTWENLSGVIHHIKNETNEKNN